MNMGVTQKPCRESGYQRNEHVYGLAKKYFFCLYIKTYGHPGNIYSIIFLLVQRNLDAWLVWVLRLCRLSQWAIIAAERKQRWERGLKSAFRWEGVCFCHLKQSSGQLQRASGGNTTLWWCGTALGDWEQAAHLHFETFPGVWCHTWEELSEANCSTPILSVFSGAKWPALLDCWLRRRLGLENWKVMSSNTNITRLLQLNWCV